MAILRGGRRIGNMDIRMGIPRDRSLDNVAGDKRLKRTMGTSPESAMGRFMGYVIEGEGFAKSNKFLVDFILPQGVDQGFDTVDMGGADVAATIPFEEEVRYATKTGDMQQVKTLQRGLRAYCDTIGLPSRNIDTTPFRTYGPKREIPYSYSFSGELTATFYCDKYLRQRQFFEMWQQAIFNQNTHNLNFYDEYVGGMRIYQLGAFSGGNTDQMGGEGTRDRISYGVTLYEVFPKTITELGMDFASAEIQKISVGFQYRKWENFTFDQMGNYTTGTGFSQPVVKEGRMGLLNSILGKLPPEMRRAGRDVVQTIRRNLPIGPITGGRVFPPFL